MQKGLTWFLTILAAALFAFIYFFERKVPGTAERGSAPKIFPTLQANDIAAVEITLPGGGVLRAEQTNGTWFLTKPLYPAQQSLIETFVTNVARLRSYDRIPPQKVALEGRKSFGLEPPRAAIAAIGMKTALKEVMVIGPRPVVLMVLQTVLLAALVAALIAFGWGQA